MKAQNLYKVILVLFALLAFLSCSKLEKTVSNQAPGIPADPYPADGAALDNVDIEFVWSCSDPDGDPLTYDIYLDTVATPAICDSLVDTTSYSPSKLYYNATHYWQVVAIDDLGFETVGPVWSFSIGDDITLPEVTVTAPNGGELWYVDNEYNITWDASDDDSVASYKLEYSADEGSTWVDIQDWMDGNPGTYAWTVPATPSTFHLVRVSCQDFAGNIASDVSDEVFTAWPEGGMIAFTSTRDGTYDIFTMFADGSHQQNISNSTSDDYSPSWSPDCSKITFYSTRDGNLEVYVMNSDGTDQVNISNDAASDAWPFWSPNGDKIVFSTIRTGNYEVYIMDVDGSNQFNLTNNAANDYYSSWSPDAMGIAFHSDRNANFDIYKMDNDGSNQIRLTTHALTDAYPAWSPNGLLIAFSSFRDGNWEIYIMNAEDGSGQHNISINGSQDLSSQWSPDGTRIAFQSDRSGDYEIFTMNSDGTNPVNITNSPASFEGYVNWSPIY